MPYKIQKEQVDRLLIELAKEFQKQNGKGRDVEMIIVGGGSILINYGFRDYTDDFDYLSRDSRALQEAAIPVREKYELEYHWINGDFKETPSYSEKLYQFSSHYKTFNHGTFEVRTIRGEYLIAMKMVAGRMYKTDRSDILGIMISEAKSGNRIEFAEIKKAITDLYSNTSIDERIWKSVKGWCEMSEEELENEYPKVKEHEAYYADAVRKEAVESEQGVSMAKVSDILNRAYHEAMERERTQTIEDDFDDPNFDL